MDDDYQRQRDRMVERQIRGRGVTDEGVLRAMRTVPRHLFVPAALRSKAYADRPLPIGREQTISQPYVVALMTALCGLSGRERVLEVGTGSGYQTMILSLLAGEVHSVEIVPELHGAASARLEAFGCGNVTTHLGNGYAGLPDSAPFDVVMLTAAPESLPGALVAQLNSNRGVLVAPVGAGEAQDLVRIVVEWGRVRRESICPVRFVPMVEEAGR